MKRGMGFALCLVGFALMMAMGILAVVNRIGTDDALYYKLQMKAGILPSAGVSGEELLMLDAALAACLKGDAAALELQAEVFGVVQDAFNEKERIHMEDCRRLFELLRTVLAVCLVAGGLMLAAGVRMLRRRRKWIVRAAWLALPLLLVPLGAFALWAAVDFQAAFNFFHEMLFTNDLWLLDPRTDLLIRLCPASMFMNMGIRIALLGFGWLLCVPLLTTELVRKVKERG